LNTNESFRDELTGEAAVPLEHSLHVGLATLKCIQVPDENAGVHRLWVLRIGLIAHFAHLHRLKRREKKLTSLF